MPTTRSGKFLEAKIRTVDGLIWIATDFSAPDRIQIGILDQTVQNLSEGLPRHMHLPKFCAGSYAVIERQEVRRLIAALFPLPGYRDLHSVNYYRCSDHSEVTIELLQKNIFRLTICNVSAYCQCQCALKLLTALLLTATSSLRIEN